MKLVRLVFTACLSFALVGCARSTSGDAKVSLSDNEREAALEFIDRPPLLAYAFHPRRAEKRTPPGVVDFDIPVAAGITVGARLHGTDKSRRSILFFHGNGEIVPDYDDIVEEYDELGLNIFIVDYRGYGWSKGTPTFRSLRDDTAPVVEFFLKQIDPTAPKPILMGRSIGSGPASIAASDPRFKDRFAGLILESGFGDVVPLLRLFGIESDEHEPALIQMFSNHLKLRATKLPTLLLHGEFDMLIKVTAAKQNFAAIPHDKKKLVILAGVGHNDILTRRAEYFGTIREFVGGL